MDRNAPNDEVLKPLEGTSLELYGETMFFALGGVYILQFILAMAHFMRQFNFVKQFDSGNSCMRDFTLHLRGLPRSMTHEGKLKEIVERQFNCKGEVKGVSIGYDLSKPEVGSKVFDMFEHRMVRADVAFYCANLDSPMVKAGWGYPPHLAKREQLDTIGDRKKFRELWDSGVLQCSGHAFVVFKSKSILNAIESKYRGMWVQSKIRPTEAEVRELQKPNMLSKDFKGRYRDEMVEPDHKTQERTFRFITEDIRIGGNLLFAGARFYNAETLAAGEEILTESCAVVVDDTLEPTSTMWFNFGTPSKQRTKNSWRHMFVLLGIWILISLAIYFPLFYFLVAPCGLAKFNPSVMAAQLQGMSLAIAGNILGVVNWNSVCAIGYYSKREQDEQFVYFSTFVNFFNSICFIAAGLSYYIETGFNKVDLNNLQENDAVDFVRERQLFDAFYNMLMPGWLFAGVLTGKFMGWFMPVIQNYVLTSAVFSMGCLPDPIRQLLTAIIPWNPSIDWLSARQAEHIFEPPELALAWEYNMYIVTPCVCMVSLFFMSPRTWKVFAFLAFWGIFMYLLHRYPTLLISKKHMTSYKVDLLACKLWGFPLSMILAAFGYWGVRCNRLGTNTNLGSYWVVCFLFLLGLVLHRLALELLSRGGVKAVDLQDRPYHVVEQKLRYTWFNTNPVHILKSCYYVEKMGEGVEDTRAFVPFEFGKEYLQIFAEDSGLQMIDEEEERLKAQV